MRIITDEREYTGKGAVLALGMFDGVHIGHRALIGRAVEMAKEIGVDSMVCTFDRHPRSVLFPDNAPVPLMTQDEQLAEFEKLGVDWALVKPFDRKFAAVPAEDYITSLIWATYAQGIVCGGDYSFGRGGKGNPAMLAELSCEYGYRLEVLDCIKDGDDIVSSTLIRALIANGDTARADRLLGR
ncbi:MAG: FAD synthetase family protein [Clostridia bacterium]|nr:FAD synthetase family protein [Clostridia bacterium]